MKIALIEDEAWTARDLAKTITGIDPDAQIVATLSSVEEGIAYLSAQPRLDLIFSDIKLGDGLSFEIFEATANKTPVIFCTAYDAYALQAFAATGVDYLLKPFSRNTVERALAKYAALRSQLGSASQATDFSSAISTLRRQLQPAKLPGVVVHQGDKIFALGGEQIAFFVIDADYVFAHTFEGKRQLLNQKLDTLEQRFAPTFFRANRQYLINRRAVRDAAHHVHRKIVVNLILPTPEPVLIGKLKVTAFLDWLANT